LKAKEVAALVARVRTIRIGLTTAACACGTLAFGNALGLTAKQLAAVLCVGIAGGVTLGRCTGACGTLERGGIAAGAGLTGLGARAAATAFALTVFGITGLAGGAGFSGAFVVFADVRHVVADLGGLAVLVSATLLTSACVGTALGPCGRAFHS